MVLVDYALVFAHIRQDVLSWAIFRLTDYVSGEQLMAEYLTAAELGTQLRLSREKILTMARTGQIPSIRLSAKTIRFDPAAVAAAINAKKEVRP